MSDLVPALALDGLNESHPILQDVKNPNEISSLFDSISYSKVCSITYSSIYSNQDYAIL